MNPHVTIVIAYQAQQGRSDEAREALAALIATVVRTEPACHGIQLYQDTADATRILLVEQWTDRETYFGPHMQTPHLTAFRERAPAFLAGPPEISVWHQHADVRR